MKQSRKSNESKLNQKQEIRRSGRPRTVNSFYTQSINQLKQVIKYQKNIHKKSQKRNKLQQEYNLGNSFNQDDQCSMQLQQNWRQAIINQGDVKRILWINIVPPKKNSYETQKKAEKILEQKKKNTIKKKHSFYKEELENKEKNNKCVSLLDILLGAAKKVAEENSEQHFQEKKDDQIKKDEIIEDNQEQKKLENKIKIRKDQQQQQIKKYLRMESKYKNLTKRFEEIKNSIELQI